MAAIWSPVSTLKWIQGHTGDQIAAMMPPDCAPSIEDVLADAGAVRTDVTAVALGVGPGPFTGLRAGLVTARVLGLALQVPVHAVCSHDALALQVVADDATGVRPGERFAVATDARRRELYWAVHVAGTPTAPAPPERVHGPHVTP